MYRLTSRVKRGLLIILIIIAIIYYSDIRPNSIVNADNLKDYSNTYLAEYTKLIDQNFGHEHGYYFKFYGNYPYNIKSVVSTQNGVAIEIIPSPTGSYESKISSDKIEDAILEKNLFNNPEIHISDSKNFTIFNWGGSSGGKMFLLNNTHNARMSGIVIFTNQGSFMDFINSELILNEMIIDNIYYPYVYFNSCNKKKCWTEELAKQRAFYILKEDGLPESFIAAFERDEFKEYFAYPELESIIKTMVDKKKHDSNYGFNQWESDFKKLNNIGTNKYGVSNEYINKTINFIDSKSILKKEFPLLGVEYEDNWSYSGAFLLFVLFSFPVGYFIKKIKKSPEHSEFYLASSIYIVSLQNPPYEYTLWQRALPSLPILIYLLYSFLKITKHHK